MTNYLAVTSLGQQVNLKGPLGPGLALTPDFQGHTAGFAAGTGVIPFIDLAHYIGQNEKGQSPIAQGISMTLYVAFATRGMSFGLEKLQQLAEGSQRLKLVIHISDEPNTKRIDKGMIQEFMSENPLKVWACGPSGFNRFVSDTLSDCNYPREQVILLWVRKLVKKYEIRDIKK